VSSAVQLTLDGLPLDPNEVARLLAHERSALYRELKLHPLQIAAAEEAVRQVIAGHYRGRDA
jgi:hypothetical protein